MENHYSTSITLIVPVYNALSDVMLCLQTIKENYNKKYEFIVVDDCSEAQTATYLEQFASENDFVQLYKNKENLGFVKTCNFAMQKAKGDIVVLLNSDTIIPSKFAEKIITAFEVNKNAGIACPIPSHSGQFNLEMPSGFNVETMNTFINEKHSPTYPKLPSCNGFCFCIRRAVIDSIGFFDEVYGKGYGEEVDYSYRAITHNFDCVLIDNLYVFHKRHASFGKRSKKLDKLHRHRLKDYWGNFEENWIKNNQYEDPVRQIERKLFPKKTINHNTVTLFGFNIIKKTKSENGVRTIYFCGMKIFSYMKKDKNTVRLKKLDKKIKKFKNLGIQNNKLSNKIIISLTSFPERMYDIHYVLYSLLDQSLKPDMLILWLGEEEFPQKEQDLPESVLDLKKNGLTIEWCKDIKSYKKLIPSLKKYPDDIIVTADDDIYYPKNWLKDLDEAYKKEPEYIHTHRAHKIRFSKDGDMLPYKQWNYQSENRTTSFLNFPTSGGGILYSPNSLHKDVLDEAIFMKLAPHADDVWFWAMAVKNNKQIKIIPSQFWLDHINPERTYGKSPEFTLASINHEQNQNDVQLQAVLNHYPEILEIIHETNNNNNML